MSIPSLCQVRINEYKISENKTSTFTHNELERKIQEIFNESIVQYLISKVSTERVAQFEYSLVNAAMEGKNFGDITIVGKNGNYSLSQHVQHLKVKSPSKEREETLAACTRIESMVRELMDSLRSKEEDPSKALAGRIKELELENESLKKQTALLQAWKAGSTTAIADHEENALSDTEQLKSYEKLFQVYKAKLDDAKSSIDELTSANTGLEEAMVSKTALIEELEGKLESAAASKEQLQEAQRALSAAKKQISLLEDLNSRNKTSKQEIQSANSLIAELQEKLTKGLDTEKKLQEASVSANKQIRDQRKTIKAKSDEIARLKKTLELKDTQQIEASAVLVTLFRELEKLNSSSVKGLDPIINKFQGKIRDLSST